MYRSTVQYLYICLPLPGVGGVGLALLLRQALQLVAELPQRGVCFLKSFIGVSDDAINSARFTHVFNENVNIQISSIDPFSRYRSIACQLNPSNNGWFLDRFFKVL